eukprot:scaffold15126_cov42-Phaeocystis_antarctica.AAC.1
MGCGKVPTIITKKAARVECENGRKLLSFPVLCGPETPTPHARASAELPCQGLCGRGSGRAWGVPSRAQDSTALDAK